MLYLLINMNYYVLLMLNMNIMFLKFWSKNIQMKLNTERHMNLQDVVLGSLRNIMIKKINFIMCLKFQSIYEGTVYEPILSCLFHTFLALLRKHHLVSSILWSYGKYKETSWKIVSNNKKIINLNIIGMLFLFNLNLEVTFFLVKCDKSKIFVLEKKEEHNFIIKDKLKNSFIMWGQKHLIKIFISRHLHHLTKHLRVRNSIN